MIGEDFGKALQKILADRPIHIGCGGDIRGRLVRIEGAHHLYWCEKCQEHWEDFPSNVSCLSSTWETYGGVDE